MTPRFLLDCSRIWWVEALRLSTGPDIQKARPGPVAREFLLQWSQEPKFGTAKTKRLIGRSKAWGSAQHARAHVFRKQASNGVPALWRHSGILLTGAVSRKHSSGLSWQISILISKPSSCSKSLTHEHGPTILDIGLGGRSCGLAAIVLLHLPVHYTTLAYNTTTSHLVHIETSSRRLVLSCRSSACSKQAPFPIIRAVGVVPSVGLGPC